LIERLSDRGIAPSDTLFSSDIYCNLSLLPILLILFYALFLSISPTQSSFMGGHNIFEEVVILRETIH